MTSYLKFFNEISSKMKTSKLNNWLIGWSIKITLRQFLAGESEVVGVAGAHRRGREDTDENLGPKFIHLSICGLHNLLKPTCSSPWWREASRWLHHPRFSFPHLWRIIQAPPHPFTSPRRRWRGSSDKISESSCRQKYQSQGDAEEEFSVRYRGHHQKLETVRHDGHKRLDMVGYGWLSSQCNGFLF